MLRKESNKIHMIRRLWLLGIPLTSCMPATSPLAEDSSQLTDHSDLSEITSNIYHGTYRFRSEGEQFHAKNSLAGLDVRFKQDMAELIPHNSTDAVGLRLAAWGRETKLAPVTPFESMFLGDCVDSGEVDASGRCLERLEIEREGIHEWWINRPSGLEQGWELAQRIPGHGNVILEIEVTGATLDSDASHDTVWLTSDSGELLRYSGLMAWDAHGVELPAIMDVENNRILLVIDDTHATWPITIDPTVDTANSLVTGSYSAANFGSRIALGDVNNDDRPDLLVGAPSLDNGSGAFTNEGGIFLYLMDSDQTYPATADFIKYGGVANIALGTSVLLTDTDGDGYDDIAAGAPGAGTGGEVWFWRITSGAQAANPASVTRIEFTTTAAGDQFGAAIAAMPALDEDSSTGIVIGAPGDDSDNGWVGIYAEGPFTVDVPRASATYTYGGDSAEAYGSAVATRRFDISAGENGVTLYVGAPDDDSGQGRVYTYQTPAGSPDSMPNVSDDSVESNVDDAKFGSSVAALDIDNDGDSDLLVGSPNYDDGDADAGRAYLFRGNAGVYPASPDWSSSISLADGGDLCGLYVASVGDVIGSSYEDFMIGCPGHTSDAGRVLLFAGTSGSISATPSVVSGPTGGEFGTSIAAWENASDSYVAIAAPETSSTKGQVYLYGADIDEDGYASYIDCDDTNAAAHPGATEIPGNDVDEDCDDFATCYVDNDGDGYGTTTTTDIAASQGEATDIDGCDDKAAHVADDDEDCNDNASGTHPGATEVVGNSVDEDCSGTATCYVDTDQDGYGHTSSTTTLAATQGVANDADGCDDKAASVANDNSDCDDSSNSDYPGATETTANGDDENCDGKETCYVNADNDGYRLDTTTTSADTDCSDSGEALSSLPNGDCDDSSNTDYPGAAETTGNSDDENCDGKETCYVNADNDGYRLTSTVVSSDTDCSDAGEALTSLPSTDCNDSVNTIYPGATETIANGIDEDCDSVDSCYTDSDNDGYGSSVVVDGLTLNCVTDGNRAAVNTDCDDSDSGDYPGATETLANGDDEDCDGKETCYVNADNDGYRLGTTVVSNDFDCSDSGEAISSLPSNDCDDTDSNDYPGATEIVANGDDEDCDGVDSCYQDLDNDGFGSTTQIDALTLNCVTDANRAAVNTDCDDNDIGDYPSASEITANGDDENCDGKETCYVDADNDGYRLSSTVVSSDMDCSDSGEALVSDPTGDCVDTNPLVYTGATEVCSDNLDSDCSHNGDVDLEDEDDDGLDYGDETPVGGNDCLTDSDADGISDVTEWNRDTDNDKIADLADTDDDGDGIATVTEGTVDTDGDGTKNYLDTDDDGDGVSTKIEGSSDLDGDGIKDYLDTDDDGDGISTKTEGSSTDTDKDGLKNYLDTDDDGDGISSVIEGTKDTDGDGKLNYLDTDDDGDDVRTSIEGVVDSDNDSTPDYLDTDDDGDGISTKEEYSYSAADAVLASDCEDNVPPVELDSIPNYLDTDSDGDGILDTTETIADSDNDQLPNFIDCNDKDGCAADQDSDGLSNCIEAELGTDPFSTDSDGDGMSDPDEVGDTEAPINTDGDAFIDAIDSDDDGDGILTIDEDRNENGNLADDDQDDDSFSDYLDSDDDGDGIATLDEDVDDDGDPSNDNTDADEFPNYLDTDDDGDGVPTRVEIAEFLGDDDVLANPELADVDNDGTPDHLDTDSDNDGISDLNELSGDTDSDGFANRFDADDDGDGILTIIEGETDTDDDDIPNYLDTDDDGDGIPSLVEGSFDPDNDGKPNYLDTDANGDGVSDNGATTDADEDGIPDVIDPDPTDGPATNYPTENDGDQHFDRPALCGSIPTHHLGPWAIIVGMVAGWMRRPKRRD